MFLVLFLKRTQLINYSRWCLRLCIMETHQLPCSLKGVSSNWQSSNQVASLSPERAVCRPNRPSFSRLFTYAGLGFRSSLARWLDSLAEYNYVIKYVPGKKNTAANVVSHRTSAVSQIEPQNYPVFKHWSTSFGFLTLHHHLGCLRLQGNRVGTAAGLSCLKCGVKAWIKHG
jgi:hypothetical protein